MKRYIKSAILPVSEMDWITQEEIALDPNTPTEVLDELANIQTYSKYNDKLYYICSNPNVSFDTVLRFHEKYPDDGRFVCALARHKDTPSDMLDDLVLTGKLYSKSDYYSIKDAITKNPNTTTKTLIKIYEQNKDNPYIRATLSIRSDVPNEVISDILETSHGYDTDDEVLLNIIKNNNLTQEQFDRICRLAHICGLSLPKVSLFLAKSDRTSPKVLSDFMSIPGYYYSDVRRAIYENPNTPETTKEWIYKRYFAGE